MRSLANAILEFGTCVRIWIVMILQEQIEELLSRPADERRRLLRLLEERLTGEREGEPEPERNGEPSAAAKWLLAMSGRFSGGSGVTASRADEILRAEINNKSGLTTK